MNRTDAKTQRQTRLRRKLKNVTSRPRLNVFRSNQYCYAQITDINGNTVLGLSEKVVVKDSKEKSTPIERARKLGTSIAKMALDKKIKEVAFDKGRFAYHGRVKAIAEGAREGGLQF
jgi:large subunit ribosomal protein L18